MSAPKALKQAAKLLDDAGSIGKSLDNQPVTMSSFGKGIADDEQRAIDELMGTQAGKVEEIDIGATPLPEQGFLPPDEEQAINDLLGVKSVGQPTEATSLDVEIALMETLDDGEFKGSMGDMMDHAAAKHPNLPEYFVQEKAQQVEVGLITPQEFVKILQKTDENWDEAKPKIFDQIYSELMSYPHTDFIDGPIETIVDDLANNVFKGDLDITDAKDHIKQLVIGGAEDADELSEMQLVELLPNYGLAGHNTIQSLGKEWTLKLLQLMDENVVDEQMAKDFIAANELKSIAEPMSDELASVWDKVTDFFEEDPATLGAMVKKGVDVKKVATNNGWLDMNSPNSRLTMEEQLDMVAHLPSYKKATEWVRMLMPEEQQALSAMTFVRSQGFLKLPEEIRSTKYVEDSSSYVGKSTYTWPTKETVDQLDDMDIAAINWYTKRGDSVMNEALRNNADLTGTDLGESLNATINALDKLPSWDLNDGQYLQRYVGDPSVGQLYLSMEPGQEYIEKGFKSTTYRQFVNPETGELNPDVAASPVYIVTKPKENGNGKAMEYLSEFEHEREVLFKPRTRFKFIRAKEFPQEKDKFGRIISSGRVVVFVEEM